MSPCRLRANQYDPWFHLNSRLADAHFIPGNGGRRRRISTAQLGKRLPHAPAGACSHRSLSENRTTKVLFFPQSLFNGGSVSFFSTLVKENGRFSCLLFFIEVIFLSGTVYFSFEPKGRDFPSSVRQRGFRLPRRHIFCISRKGSFGLRSDILFCTAKKDAKKRLGFRPDGFRPSLIL